VKDPFGHKWHIATNKEVLSPDELKKRAAEVFAKK
jgi:PhnB protein